ncbi:hypothetical protein AVEN_235454-1 [Araneus ventricosus]|uniref:Tc1-like transposase DDE domain-containing protein n=1 Tax=Araneus ventricosus TaxID=182803 RepID=A0A4Y2A5L3_ARAVE|nr:hypothetical protein AVEN_235454-1 [Araneus ventricosus]
MVMSGYAVYQANSCSPLVEQVIHSLVVAVLCFGRRSHGRLWDPQLWTTPHVARLGIVLEWFEEHTDEFHLMFWPPNLPDLNPMEHIWDVMERQLRAQTPPCPNISTLRDLCLDIWCNLSPVMYQKLVASMPRRVAAILKAKRGATRY